MIHYQVRCSDGHEFDGWFKDSATFDRQAARGLIECPVCGDGRVVRALMAPALPRATLPLPPPAPAPTRPADGTTGNADKSMPDQTRAVLQRMRAEIESRCDYVGIDFADEARRIHHGASPRRGIYGEATTEEAEALNDEGIQVARIPWVDRAES